MLLTMPGCDMVDLIITLLILSGLNYALALFCRIFEYDFDHLPITAWQSFAVVLFYVIQRC